MSLDYLMPESKKYLSSDTDVSKRHRGRTSWRSSGSYSTTGNMGLIPGQGTKIPHAHTEQSKNLLKEKKSKKI